MSNRKNIISRVLTVGVLIVCTGCVEKCSPILNRSSKGRAYLDKKVVEGYFESIKKIDNNDAKYWCNPADIKFRFNDLADFYILETKSGYGSSGEPNPNWTAFKVKTRTETIWGGINGGIFWVYVKIMPDGAHKIFALKPEKDAAFWEKVTLKIDRHEDPCGFPAP